MKKYLFFSLLIVLGFSNLPLFSQNYPQNGMSELYLLAQEQMKNGAYEEANLSFRKILKLGTKLPAEMPYLFAETLFHIEQYQNSKSFLEKYFQIMGKAGTYYDNAMILSENLDKQLNKAVNCNLCDFSGYKLVSCKVCDGNKQILQTCNYCKGVGKVGCSICAGDGVLVQIGALGDKRYKTCHQCHGEGIHKCQICEGEKEFYNYCENCLGTGKVATSEICSHKS